MRAGCIDHFKATAFRRIIYLRADTVGTDDDSSILHLSQIIDSTNALLLQALDHLRIMDDWSQCTGGSISGSIFLGNRYRALDAITESQIVC